MDPKSLVHAIAAHVRMAANISALYMTRPVKGRAACGTAGSMTIGKLSSAEKTDGNSASAMLLRDGTMRLSDIVGSVMSRGRSLSALMIFFLSVLSATASVAETPLEGTVKNALETLSSGASATAVFGDTEVIVKPLRTWKSISGHYCRRYQLIVTRPASAKARSESTRCRDSGVWKLVSEG